MRKKHTQGISRYKKLFTGLLFLLLLAGCKGGEASSVATDNVEATNMPISATMTPQAELNSVDLKTPQVENTQAPPTETEEPQETLTPEEQALMEAAQASLPETMFYELEVSFSGENLVAHSPLDAEDSPHYSYVEGAWVDNHPGRNQMETELFPPVLEDGTSIWENLQEDGAVWDQEMMAYHYVNSPDADPGHEQYYQPLMAIMESNIRDIERGRVNFSETIQSEDFVLGESGVKIDFYISADHPYVKWFNPLPKDIASEVFSEMYLEKFPSLKGKHVQVRIVAEDRTHRNQKVRERTFFQGSYVALLDARKTGIIGVDGVDDLKIVTISIATDAYKDYLPAITTESHGALVWSLIVERDGEIRAGGNNIWDSANFVREAIKELMEKSGFSGPETVEAKAAE